jgi:hypothetical protein
MRNLILAALLSFATSALAQTPVAIQNSNFQSPVTFTNIDPSGAAAGSQWESGTIPSWIVGPGIAGIQQLVSVCGVNIPQGAFSNGATITQDVGPQQAGMYVLTVGICNRSDISGATYTLSLSGCNESALNSTIPPGTIQNVTLSCPISNPSGDNIIGLGCSGGQCDFSSVALTFTPAGPYVFVLPTCGASTCTFTFPIANASSLPACSSADGTCSLSIQVCDTSVTPANCLTLSTTGAINIVKNSSTNGQTVTPLVTATSP